MGNLAAIRSWSTYPILGPYAIAISGLGTTATQVIGPDTGRTGIIFHNPGTTFNKRVLPAGSSAASLAAALAALISGSGGIVIYPQEEFSILQTEDSDYNVNSAWVGVTDNAADPTLTILNFTPSTPGAPMPALTMRPQQSIPVDSPVATQVSGIGVGSTRLLSPDPNAVGVLFTNPGTVLAAVTVDNLAASIGAGSIMLLPGQTKRIIGNQRVRVNAGWNVCAQSGSNVITAQRLYG